jgi:hypothetical protein
VIWRRLSYSICLAIAITSVSYILYDRGGEFVLWPGLFGEGMCNGILLAIPSGDVFYRLPSVSYLVFNIMFYALIIFAVIFLIGRVRDTGRA